MPVTKQNIEDAFTYHAPEGDQLYRYHKVRMAALEFARVILEQTPVSADQQAAIRHVREAMMTANAAIALKGSI